MKTYYLLLITMATLLLADTARCSWLSNAVNTVVGKTIDIGTTVVKDVADVASDVVGKAADIGKGVIDNAINVTRKHVNVDVSLGNGGMKMHSLVQYYVIISLLVCVFFINA